TVIDPPGSGHGQAVLVQNNQGTGLYSIGSTTGVTGESTGYGVRGLTTNSVGVHGSASGTGYGVLGQATTGGGVYGGASASGGSGVLGATSSSGGTGVFGTTTSSGATGLLGTASVFGGIALRTNGTSFFTGDTTPLSGVGKGVAVGFRTQENVGYMFGFD